MPVYPINDHAKIAEVAAKNGWSNRTCSVTGEGATINQTYYYRDNEEILVKYNLMESMTGALIVHDHGNPDLTHTSLHRVNSVIIFMERPRVHRDDDPTLNWPQLVVRAGYITARRQDEETREWRITGRARLHADVWWGIYGDRMISVGTINKKSLPEGKDVEAVEAILRALF